MKPSLFIIICLEAAPIFYDLLPIKLLVNSISGNIRIEHFDSKFGHITGFFVWNSDSELCATCVWPEFVIVPYFADLRWSELIKRSLSYFGDFNLPWVNNESIPINLVGPHFSILVLSDTVNGHLRVFNWFALFWCIWIQKKKRTIFDTLKKKVTNQRAINHVRSS